MRHEETTAERRLIYLISAAVAYLHSGAHPPTVINPRPQVVDDCYQDSDFVPAGH